MPMCGSIWLVGKRRRQLCWLLLGLSCGRACGWGLVTKRSFFENMVSTMVLTRKQCTARRGPGLLGRGLWALALMELLACSAQPPFYVSDLASPANLPSCAVSLAGALRHGAP